MIVQNDLEDLIKAANLAGFNNVNITDLVLEHFENGENHVQQNLDANNAGIYIFKWNERYLKVGMDNSVSGKRFKVYHYNPNSTTSNLSRSLITEPEFQALIGDNHPGNWIRANTHRFNILIPKRLEKNFICFAEAFFILKCNPFFEG